MIKKIILAAALTGFVAGAAIPLHTSTAEAAPSGCVKAAKAKFAGDRKARVAYRKECRTHFKSYKSAQKAAKKAGKHAAS